MADTPPPSGALVDFVRAVSPYVPGMAGALLGMAFGANLTVRGRLLALAAGAASAIWGAPAAVILIEHFAFGGEPLHAKLVGFVGFTAGCFGMALLSGLAQAIAKYASDPLALVKIEFRGVTVTGGMNREGGVP